MSKRKQWDKASVAEAAKVRLRCDECTATIFDYLDRIEAEVSQDTGGVQSILSGGVILTFRDMDPRGRPAGEVVFFMSHSAAALLGRKLTAAAKLEGFI